MAVPVETSLNIKSVARRGGEGKGRRRRGRAGGAGAGAGWERKQTTEAEVTSEDSEEDDWVPCVKVYNPRSGGYEQKAATPLTPPGPSPSPSASPSKPKPSTKPPATVHARDRLSGCEMPSSPHIPRAVAAEAAAADGAQARLEAELAAARVKAEQAEDLAEQLRLQVLYEWSGVCVRCDTMSDRSARPVCGTKICHYTRDPQQLTARWLVYGTQGGGAADRKGERAAGERHVDARDADAERACGDGGDGAARH
jgi:hypothetical protein